MYRYLQAFDALLREEEARHPRAQLAGASDKPIFPWAGRSDPAGPPATIMLDELLRFHEYERQRIGQELHDSPASSSSPCSSASLICRRSRRDSGHGSLFQEINDTVRRIDQEIRSLAFLNYPAELGDRGLCCAVQALALGFGRRTGIRMTFRCIGDQATVDESISMALLHVAQRRLRTSIAMPMRPVQRSSLERRATHLHLTVSDDGIGMPVAGALKARGIGLQGMCHRIQMLSGRFRIGNLERGGTRVSAMRPARRLGLNSRRLPMPG